jgi:hypothetical protein
MRLHKKIYRFIIAGILLAACKKLEVSPVGFVDPSVAIANETDVKDLLNGCYTVLRDGNFMGGGYMITSELMADNVNGAALTGGYLAIYNFSTTGNTDGIATQYAKPYTIIQRANNVLEKLSLVTSSDATKKNVEGQARFMRAFSYFQTVRLFAQPWGYTSDNSHLGIVIKTNSDLETALPRSSVKAVYDFIITDLKSAEGLLPATNGDYPGSIATKALLARVYYQMNDFANAYSYSNQAIALGQTNGITFDNSAAFISNRFSNPKTTEAVFWIVNEAGQGAAFSGLRNNANLDQSMGFTITKAAFDSGTTVASDLRRAWYKDSITSTLSHIYSINKYKHPSFILPLIHITEMKLVRAESATELNQNLSVAIADINDITNRAYGGTLAALPGTATAAIIKARVRRERKLEMVFESGDRLQEIKRLGAKGETAAIGNAPWNCNGMILQFPVNEVNVNVNFIANPTGGCSR